MRNQMLLRELFQLYQQDMFRLANSILHDEYLSEDAIQNAFLKMIKYMDKLQCEATSRKAKAYCLTVVRNEANNLWQKRNKEYPDMTSIETVVEQEMAGCQDCLDELIMKESVISIGEKIQKLPEVFRESFILHHTYEHSYEEIADIMNVTAALARKRYQLARKKLQKMIQEER
ncbi:MAG: RNA polymerase sigma factor [Lachnospiraceae bacterium]